MIPKKTQERVNKQLLEDIENILFSRTHQNSLVFKDKTTDAFEESWIKKIFINNKTLTVLFSNGEHICAKCSDEDEYSIFVGFCVAMTKHILGMNAKDIREMILDKVDPKKKEEVAENLKRGTNTVRNLINSEYIKDKYQSVTFDCTNGKIIIEGKEPREPDPEPLKNFNTYNAVNQLEAINQLEKILSDERNKNEEE